MLRKINETLNRALLSALVLSSSVWAQGPVEVSDRNAIDDLISRYCHTWDSKDPKGWSELFVEDGIWENFFAGKKDKS